MSTEENKALIRRWYDEWNKGNLEGVLDLYAMDFVDHNPMPGQSGDIDGLRARLELIQNAFPKSHIDIVHLTAEGDKVASLIAFRGTNSGQFLGKPPSGKRVEVTATDVWRIVDGEIAESWHVEDNLGVLQQVGIVPAMTVNAS